MFDRCNAKLSSVTTDELMVAPLRAWTAKQLKHYSLALV